MRGSCKPKTDQKSPRMLGKNWGGRIAQKQTEKALGRWERAARAGQRQNGRKRELQRWERTGTEAQAPKQTKKALGCWERAGREHQAQNEAKKPRRAGKDLRRQDSPKTERKRAEMLKQCWELGRSTRHAAPGTERHRFQPRGISEAQPQPQINRQSPPTHYAPRVPEAGSRGAWAGIKTGA